MSEDQLPPISDALSSASAEIQTLLTSRLQYANKLFTEYSLLSDEDCGLWADINRLNALIDEVGRWDQHRCGLEKVFRRTLDVLKSLEPVFAKASANEKAQFCFLNGKALNAIQWDETSDSADSSGDDLTAQSIQWLTRALKFNPQCADAWCELGESCWRQGSPIEAATHFRQALKVQPNHVESLCLLSMALRHIASSTKPGDKSANLADTDPLTESLRLAHEAVRLEPTSGNAWSMLGNALLTSYFQSFVHTVPIKSSTTPTKSPDAAPGILSESPHLLMTRCIAAYSQAAKDRKTVAEPNFHYNRGVAWHYQGKFSHSLRCWLRAMCLDPQWAAPRNGASRLVRFVREADRWLSQFRSTTRTDNETRGENPEDRSTQSSTPQHNTSSPLTHQLQQLIEPLSPCLSLSSTDAQDPIVSPKGVSMASTESRRAALSRLLGPYCPASGDSVKPDGHVVNASASSKRKKVKSKVHNKMAKCPFASSTFEFVPFSQLQIGANKGKMCVGRILAQLPQDTELVLNYIIVDPYGHPLCLRLCNVGKGFGPVVKDILTVPHPLVEECAVSHSLLDAATRLTTAFDPTCVGHMTSQLANLQTQPGEVDTDSRVAKLRLLRVPVPDVLVVNGHSIGSSWTAAPVLKNVFFTQF